MAGHSLKTYFLSENLTCPDSKAECSRAADCGLRASRQSPVVSLSKRCTTLLESPPQKKKKAPDQGQLWARAKGLSNTRHPDRSWSLFVSLRNLRAAASEWPWLSPCSVRPAHLLKQITCGSCTMAITAWSVKVAWDRKRGGGARTLYTMALPSCFASLPR